MKDDTDTVGDKLRETLHSLQREISDLENTLQGIKDAWRAHDWKWLRESGVITAAEYKIMTDATETP